MADLEEFIVTKVKTDLVSLIGSRITPGRLDQETAYPAIFYNRVDTVRILTHDQDDTGLVQSRVQFDIYGETYESVRDVTNALRTSFQGHQDLTADPMIHGAWLRLEQTSTEADPPLYRAIVDIMFSYQE